MPVVMTAVLVLLQTNTMPLLIVSILLIPGSMYCDLMPSHRHQSLYLPATKQEAGELSCLNQDVAYEKGPTRWLANHQRAA